MSHIMKNAFPAKCLNRLVASRSYSVAASSSSNLINVTVDGKKGTAVVEMNGPPVNSLNTTMIKSLTQTLADLEKDKCRGLVLTSALKTTFCAGLDIREMYKPQLEKLKDFWGSLQELWIKLYGSPLITVAAINGHSPAGGCLLAMCCDYRVMVGPEYRIGLNETKLGIVAPFWFKDTMINTVGVRQTDLALQLGTLFTATKAHQIGLVDELVDTKENALAAADKVLTEFLTIPSKARHLSKLVVRQETINKLIAHRESDTQAFVTFCTSAKVQQGLETYLENLSKKKKE